MKNLFPLLILLCVGTYVHAQQIITIQASQHTFPLPEVICIDQQDDWLVGKAADLLREDVKRVMGRDVEVVYRPALGGGEHGLTVGRVSKADSLSGEHGLTVDRVTKADSLSGKQRIPPDRLPQKAGPFIFIGTLQSSFIKALHLDTSGLTGKWEAFRITASQGRLCVIGSDKRGAAYGALELSRQLGVSPWYWWADVPVKKKEKVYVQEGRYDFGPPSVQYRGIFINDEAPAFSGWTHEKFGGFNHLVYEKVFELLLRLRGNYLWPAMWGNAFNKDDTLNPILADKWGIVMGTSHHEPMLRAQQEWKRYGRGAWDYVSNDSMLRAFWRKGIENMGRHESIVTVGMRGDGDMPMSNETATDLLERIVKDQREIISEVTGKPASETPQMWALYKEVQDYYDKGMRVPDDVTLLLCDDNWGNIRRLPEVEAVGKRAEVPVTGIGKAGHEWEDEKAVGKRAEVSVAGIGMAGREWEDEKAVGKRAEVPVTGIGKAGHEWEDEKAVGKRAEVPVAGIGMAGREWEDEKAVGKRAEVSVAGIGMAGREWEDEKAVGKRAEVSVAGIGKAGREWEDEKAVEKRAEVPVAGIGMAGREREDEKAVEKRAEVPVAGIGMAGREREDEKAVQEVPVGKAVPERENKKGMQKRKGGYGIYYHFDYVGDPRNYKWINTNNLARVWEQLHLAKMYGADKVWIVNVGDLKPMELPISFFMDYAWNAEDTMRDWYSEFAEENLGERKIGGYLKQYSEMAARRKPELLDEYSYTLKQYKEIVAEWADLAKKVQLMVNSKAPSAAYFQLVQYPVEAMYNLHRLYYAVALYKSDKVKNKSYADSAHVYYQRDSLLTLAYHQMGNGKWNHMMDQTHIGYTGWQQPMENKMPDLSGTYQPPVVLPVINKRIIATDYVEKQGDWQVLKGIGKFGDGMTSFAVNNTESGTDGSRSVEKKAAQNPALNNTESNTNGSRSVEKKAAQNPALNNTESNTDDSTSVENNPAQNPALNNAESNTDGSKSVEKKAAQNPGLNDAESNTNGSRSVENNHAQNPALKYAFEATGDNNIYLNFSPTLNFPHGKGLAISISIDGEEPVEMTINSHDDDKKIWEQWVANNIIQIKLTRTFKPGKHMLVYAQYSPGIVFQSIELEKTETTKHK